MAKISMAEAADLVRKEAAKQGVDPETAFSILVAENTADGVFKPDKMIDLGVKSPVGATGVMQVMPNTFSALQRQGFVDANHTLDTLEGQIAGGVGAIKELMGRIGTDRTKIAIGYNASPKVGQLYEKTGVLPAETAGYIKKQARALGMADTPDPSTTSGAIRIGSSGIGEQTFGAAQTAVSRFVQNMQAAMGLQADLVNQDSASTEEAKGATDALAKAQEKSANATADERLTAAREMQARLEFFGLDRKKEDSMISNANRQLSIADQELMNLKPEVDALKSTDPLKDPINWFLNQFKMIGVADRWNAAATARDTAVQVIAARQQLTDAQGKLEPALNEAALKQQTEATVEAAVAQATLAKSKLDSANRMNRLNAVQTAISFYGNQTSFELQLARLGMDATQFSVAMGEKSGKAEQLGALNEAAARLGLKPFKTMEELKLYYPGKEDLLLAASRYKATLGGSPAEAMTVITAFNAKEHLRQQMPEAGVFIDEFQAKAKKVMDQKRLADPAYKSLKPEEQASKAFEEVYQGWITEAKKRSYESLSDGNPYKMRARLYAANPELENNIFAQYVRTYPEGQAPREQELFGYAQGQLAAGKPRAAVIRDLQEFFAKGMIYQHERLGLGMLNFNPADPSSEKGAIRYRLTPSVVGNLSSMENFFGSQENEKQRDALNPADLDNMLTLIFARSSAAQMPDLQQRLIKLDKSLQPPVDNRPGKQQ